MNKMIEEGKVKVFTYTGKISKKLRVFYNPEMRLNRDISTLVFKVFAEQAKKPKKTKKPITVADILAATGIRGLRYAKEVSGIKVLLNDLNPSAIKLMRKNIKLNKVKNVAIFREDANVFLSQHKYALDVIDIDPFGSPIDFLDSAARAIRNDGLLMITATDTAPLSGTYPKTCLRRYGAMPMRTDIQHEVGIRILIGVIARECAKYDKAFTPLLCLAHRHYFRVWGAAKKSKTLANKAIENIGYIVYCKKCGFRQFSAEALKTCPNCKKEINWAGPLWIGKIFDSKFCDAVSNLCTSGEACAVLSTMQEESRITALFYDIHSLCKVYKCKEVPATEEIIKALRKKGFRASRTHFSPTAVRTNADIKTILNLRGKFEMQTK